MLFALFSALLAPVVAQSASSPAPCASALPATLTTVAGASASPAPCPSETAVLREIGKVKTVGRKANLVGRAISASTGTIDQEQIAMRPLLRPGEVLEAIPGLVISQHSGGGKANQYYLRGFQLDHGTNLDASLVGVPVNLPSHAHGQGYSDINYLMPELVSFVEFKKGLYFADQGDFAVAGGYNLYYRNTIAPTSTLSVGDFGYDRFFTAASPRIGAGNLLYALEIAHDNGSYVKADQYHRYNGVLRYSLAKGNDTLALTGIAYNGAFNSTDQIPQRLVDSGQLDRFGYIDPSDGGNTYRYALSSQFTHTDPNGTTKINAYGVNSFLALFSNFTYNYDDANDYYNVTRNPVTCRTVYSTCTPNAGGPDAPRAAAYTSYCPANQAAPGPGGVPQPFFFSCGDQRQQVDKRVYYGFDVSRSFNTPGTATTVGFSLRTDNIAMNALHLDRAKQQFPGSTLSADHITERSIGAFVSSELRVGSKLRLTPGLRADFFSMKVGAFDASNSGIASEALLGPKFAMSYAFSPRGEFYLDAGESFHSNDARGVIGPNDPQTHQPFDPGGVPVQKNSPLTRASGEEIGYRYSTPKLTTTLSAFQLLVANELLFDGDHGTTSVGRPDVRRGLELANYYTPANWLTLDADLATTTARFIADPNHLGTGVPESLAGVVSLGATVDTSRYAASLRMRYFGPRQLDSAGDFKSTPSTVFNTQLTAKMAHGMRVSLDLFNVFNSHTADVTYNYNSWTRQDAADPALANDPAVNPALGGAGVGDNHFHPAQKRTIRLTLSSSRF